MQETKTLGTSMEVTGKGAEKFSEIIKPGQVYGLDLTQADLDSLTKIGKRLGHASSALEVGLGTYEWISGEKSFGRAASDVGGSLAGAWALGQAGAYIGAPAGPVGSFALGAVGAIAGGIGGEKLADNLYKYLGGT